MEGLLSKKKIQAHYGIDQKKAEINQASRISNEGHFPFQIFEIPSQHEQVQEAYNKDAGYPKRQVHKKSLHTHENQRHCHPKSIPQALKEKVLSDSTMEELQEIHILR